MPSVVRTLLGWLAGGSALAALVSVVGIICGLVIGLVYRRYLGILGADRRRPAERQAYDALRESLGEGNLAARLYAEQLTRFLDWIDHFFGDAGMADRTLFADAFGLRTPAPLWTAPAFDRCLLLALLYPVATIFTIWAVSGHVGLAEAALRLKPDLSVWQRGLVVAGSGYRFSRRSASGEQGGRDFLCGFSLLCVSALPLVSVLLGLSLLVSQLQALELFLCLSLAVP